MDKTTIDNNLKEQLHEKNSFKDWKPLDLGGLKPTAKDWKNNEAIDEMIDERHKD